MEWPIYQRHGQQRRSQELLSLKSSKHYKTLFTHDCKQYLLFIDQYNCTYMIAWPSWVWQYNTDILERNTFGRFRWPCTSAFYLAMLGPCYCIVGPCFGRTLLWSDLAMLGPCYARNLLWSDLAMVGRCYSRTLLWSDLAMVGPCYGWTLQCLNMLYIYGPYNGPTLLLTL